MWRRVAVLALCVVLLLAGGVAALRSQRANIFLKDHIERLLSLRLGQPVHIGDLQLGVLPPTLTLADIVVTPNAQGVVDLKCARVWVEPSLWPTADGRLALRHLEVTGVRGRIPFDLMDLMAPSPQETAHSKGHKARFPIDVHLWQVRDVSLTLAQGDNWVVLDGATLGASKNADGRVRFFAHVPVGGVYLPDILGPGTVHPFTWRMDSELSGPWDAPTLIQLTQWNLNVPGLNFTAQGDIVPVGRKPTVKIEGRLDGDLASAATWFGLHHRITGQIDARVTMVGQPAHPTLLWDMGLSNLAIDARPLGDVAVEAAATRQSAVIQSFAWNIPDGGRVTGSGDVSFNEEKSVHASVRLHDTSVPVVLALAGLPGAWVRQELSGDLTLLGKLAPLQLRLGFDGQSRNFAVLDASYLHPKAKLNMAIAEGQIRGSASVDRHGVALQNVTVSVGGSEATLDGNLHFDVARGLGLEVSAPRPFDVAVLGPIAEIAFAGVGQVHVRLQGPYRSIRITSEIEVDDFAVHGYALGHTRGKLWYEQLTLSLLEARSGIGDGSVQGRGALHFGDHGAVDVEGHFAAHSVPLQELLTRLLVPQSLAANLQGEVDGLLDIRGPLLAPAGTCRFTATGLVVASAPLGSATLLGTLGEGDDMASGTVTLDLEQGQAHAQAGYSRQGMLRLLTEVHDLSWRTVGKIMGDVPQDGSLDATLALTGPLHALDGHLDAASRDHSIDNLSVGPWTLRGVITDNTVRLVGSLSAKHLPMQAAIALHGDWPMTGRIHLESDGPLRLDGVVNDLAAEFSTRVDVKGNLLLPKELTFDMQVERLALVVGGTPLAHTHPFALHFANGTLWVHDQTPIVLVANKARAWLRGQANSAQLRLQLAARGDVGFIQTLWPALRYAHGPFTMDVGIHGTPQAPAFVGEADVRGISFAFGDVESATATQISDFRLHAVFAGLGITFTGGRARLGDGRATFGGEILWLPQQHGPRFNLSASLMRVGVHPLPDLDAVFTGELALEGPSTDLAMSGRLNIDQLRYSARLDLDKIIPRRNAPPLRVAGLAQFPPVKLAVKLHASNNILLSSQVLEAELQGDVTVTGTPQRLGMLGSVAPLWARARYRDNTFKVTRATVDFVDEFRLLTEFSVQARTQACNLTADVTVAGSSDSYAVTTSGVDEHGVVDPQDVLACLQFGLRLHDFAGNQRGQAGIGDALPGSLDALWTVSGMDDKVKKLLPIDVDELRLTSGWSSLSQRTTARVLVGKELGRSLGLRYSRSIDEFNDQALSIVYRLGRRVSAEGTWLSVRDVPVGDFGVDLRLHWELP